MNDMDMLNAILKIILCCFMGFVVSLPIQKMKQKKLQDELIKQGQVDNKTISRIYLSRYKNSMHLRNKKEMKRSVELNYMMCSAKDDTCLKTKFCPGCSSDFGWADANVEYNEEDLKDI